MSIWFFRVISNSDVEIRGGRKCESNFAHSPKPQTMGITTRQGARGLAGGLYANAIALWNAWQDKAKEGAPRQE